ncbi:MAG: hemagglutinin repeat-containing protein, partial [Salinarimonas sp.]
DLQLQAQGALELHGRYAVDGRLTAVAEDIALVDGDIAAGDAVIMEARDALSVRGQVLSGSDVSFIADGALDARGRIIAGGRAALEGDSIATEALELGGRDVSVIAQNELALGAGTIAALDDIAIVGDNVRLAQGLDFGAPGRFFVIARGDFENATILDHANLALSVEGSFTNAATGVYLRDQLVLILGGDLVNEGLIQGLQSTTISARALDNRAGGVIDAPLVMIGLSGAANNAGTVHGADGVTLETASLINTLDGRIAGNGVAITLDGGLVNLGEILSPHALTIISDGLVENDGTMAAGGALTLQAVSYVAGSPAARLAGASAQLTLSGLLDNAGIIAAGGPLGLVAQSLENRADAVILSEGAATLTLTQDAANHGLVLADGALTLAAGDLANTADAVLYGADLAITSTGALANAGRILSESVAALTLAGSYSSQGGTLRASQRIDLSAAAISAQGPSEILAPVIDLITAGDFHNAGEIVATDLLIGQFGGSFGNAGIMHAFAPDGAGHLAEMGLSVIGAATNSGDIRAEGDLFFNAGSLTQQAGGHLAAARLALGLTGGLDNRGVIRAEGDLAIEAAWLVNSGNGAEEAWISGLDLSIVTSGAISAGWHSVLEGRRSTVISALSSNIDLTNSASIAQGRFNFGQDLDLTMTGQALTVGQGAQIMAAGDLSLSFAHGITVLGSVASGGNLALAAPGGSIFVGTNGSWNPGGAFLFTLGDADFAAGGSMLLTSSAVEVLGSANVSLGGTLSIARAAGPVWQFSHDQYVQGSRLWLHRWFRQQETTDASVFNVAGELAINANNVAVNASTLSAGGHLVVEANAFSNTANQLQQYYDLYKLTGSNTGYRGTFYSAWSATPSLVYAGGAFSVSAQSFSNTGTVQAHQGVIRAPSVSVGVTDRNTFTAPPSLPDPVIDLGRYVAQLPASMQRPQPQAISIDGPQYLFTAPLAGQPRYDADGLPVSEREPSWILRQVGDVRGTNGQGITFLADPITERMLIQRALVEQTGRSMLDPNFDSAIAQQEALYEGTVSFLLDNPDIRLGDTLTAAQRARVDAPMLWYVEREIDGVRVLAPELILPESRLAAYGYQPGGSVRTVESLFIEGDSVRNTGALLAGSGLTILAGEFINERRVASFQDGRNLHSRIQAGGLVSANDLMIITDGDLINRGGTLYGTQALTLAAGGDIRFEAQRVVNDIRSRGNAVGSWSHYSERHYAASAGTAGDMQIIADGGLSLLGSRLMADGDIALSARDGITVAAVTDIEENHESRRSNRFISRRSTSFGETSALNLGSLIAAGGDLTAVTAGDIAIHASDLTAGNDLLLAAGAGADGRADASITITAGTDSLARYHQEKTSAVGLLFGGGRLDFYRARNTREETMQADNRPSTLTAGGDVRVTAPGDITLQGSVVGAGGMAELIAGRDLAVTAGAEARERLFSERTSNFGFSVGSGGGSASLSLGLTRSSVLDERNRTSDVGSLIGGGEGVRLEAGRDLSAVAVQVTSPGDIDLLAGRDLTVSPGAIVETHRRVERHSFAGVTASVGTNVVSAAQDLGRAVDTFGSGYGNAGYRAIGMASGVLQGVDAVRSLSNPGVSA